MDAHAHLLSLGWAGPGHSLDSRPSYKQKGHRGLAYDPAKVGNNGAGLVKPLLVSQRKGRLGIGKKAHEPQAGNEWWLKGFESALGNIGKSESERSSGTSTPVVHEHPTGKHSGLYTFFVKGQQMEGTLGKLEELNRSSTKRQSDVLEMEDDGTSSLKKKKRKIDNAAAEFEQIGEYMALRDKDEKRRKRTERPSPVEEFRQVSEYLEMRSDKKSKKRKVEIADSAETSTPLADEEEQGGGGGEDRAETKEERRERRRRRKEEKERQRQQQTTTAEESARSTETEDAAAKAARRAERKKRKAEKAAREEASR